MCLTGPSKHCFLARHLSLSALELRPVPICLAVLVLLARKLRRLALYQSNIAAHAWKSTNHNAYVVGTRPTISAGESPVWPVESSAGCDMLLSMHLEIQWRPGNMVIEYLHHQLSAVTESRCSVNRRGHVPGTSLTAQDSYPKRSAQDLEMNRNEK